MNCKFAFALIFAVAAVLLQPASAGSMLVQGALNSTGDLYVGSGTISFFVNATSGNVGVGTSSPNSTLHIRAADNSSVPLKAESLVDFPFLGAYRKKITLAGSSAGALTDYQMRLVVYKASGTDSANTTYLNSHVRDDFNDLRFTSADGVTPLSYWIENYSYGVSAAVWVKFDSVPAAPANSTFYIYYGNANAASGSNGANTFIVFDDFNDNNFDTTKWNSAGNQFYLWERNSRLELGPGASIGVYSKATGAKRLYMSAIMRDVVDDSFSIGTGSPVLGNSTPNLNLAACCPCGNHPWYGTIPNTGYSAVFGGVSYGMSLNKAVNGTESNLNDSAVALGTPNPWYSDNVSLIYEMSLGSAGVRVMRNGTSLLSSPDSNISSGYIMVAASHIGYFYVDWIFGANYASSEPTWAAWGAEEDVSSVVRGQQSVLFVRPAVGYIGLGTTNPQARLGVRGGLRVDSSSGSIFFVNESTGSVGIGTKSPGAALHVVPAISMSGGSGGDWVYDIVDNGVAYRVHKFTTVGNSTFTPPAGTTSVEYLVVAGGGAGAGGSGGGGGAGGFRAGNLSVVEGSAINVTVGAGGVGIVHYHGTSGSDSVFGSIRSTGGGYGGSMSDAARNGATGGSGGGDGGQGAGGAGNTPATVPSQGNNGGSNGAWTTGGGGGAGAVGDNGGPTTQSGNGGTGRISTITGSSVYYAGGGGGAPYNSTLGVGSGGAGGGGAGSHTAGVSATPNTGGGGGAGDVYATATYAGGNGGSGIVVVRYPIGVAAIFQGSVGIGATSPQAALHVTGNTILNGVVYGGTACPSDMAYVPGTRPFCIDKYEAHLAAGTVSNEACVNGSQAEVDASNTTAIAGSAPGQVPLVSINWCSAKKACQNAGKHLCTNAEWSQACNYRGSQWGITAEQTTEAMACNTVGSAANLTGTSSGCVTQEGVYDMIGNVREWVDEVVTADPTNGLASNYVTGYDFATGLPTSTGVTSSNAYGNDYFAAYDGAGVARAFNRGGSGYDGANGGCFALYVFNTPSTVYALQGFRCCK